MLLKSLTKGCYKLIYISFLSISYIIFSPSIKDKAFEKNQSLNPTCLSFYHICDKTRDCNFYRTRGYLARPNTTLMGQVLPSPIKNRVEFGLKKKLKASPGQVQVFTKTRPEPINIYVQLLKYPHIYIVKTLPHLTLTIFSAIQPPLISLSSAHHCCTLTHNLIGALALKLNSSFQSHRCHNQASNTMKISTTPTKPLPIIGDLGGLRQREAK